jgi:hypothetical protein
MTELAALQAALAAEQATVYGYGVVGANLRGADRDYATAALTDHMRLRDRLMALITTLGATPVTAQPAYGLPVGTPQQLAAHLEEGVAGTLWDLIAATAASSPNRSAAIGWLAESAARAAHWGARQALPGQPA